MPSAEYEARKARFLERRRARTGAETPSTPLSPATRSAPQTTTTPTTTRTRSSMINMEFDAKSIGHLATRMRVTSAMAPAEAEKLTRMYAQHLVAKIRERAPMDTGVYRRSIRYRMRDQSGTKVAVITSTRPQARRLELGFRGTDSLGRTYDQKPRPHWTPAAAEVEPQYVMALRLRLAQLKQAPGGGR